MALNNTREPLSDPLVRQAITYAIDKTTIVEGAMFGYGTPIGSHASPIEPYYEDLTEIYPYNPDRARELLAEAGYEGGLTLDFELPPYPFERRAGEVIAQQLAEVGITANVTNVEWTTWLDRIFTQGDYDMTIIGHSEPRDIGVYGNPDYYYHYDNPEVQQTAHRHRNDQRRGRADDALPERRAHDCRGRGQRLGFQPALLGRGAKRSLRLLAGPADRRYRPDRSVFGPVNLHSSR